MKWPYIIIHRRVVYADGSVYESFDAVQQWAKRWGIWRLFLFGSLYCHIASAKSKESLIKYLMSITPADQWVEPVYDNSIDPMGSQVFRSDYFPIKRIDENGKEIRK